MHDKGVSSSVYFCFTLLKRTGIGAIALNFVIIGDHLLKIELTYSIVCITCQANGCVTDGVHNARRMHFIVHVAEQMATTSIRCMNHQFLDAQIPHPNGKMFACGSDPWFQEDFPMFLVSISYHRIHWVWIVAMIDLFWHSWRCEPHHGSQTAWSVNYVRTVSNSVCGWFYPFVE